MPGIRIIALWVLLTPALCIAAGEQQLLSLQLVQPLHATDVMATGRIVPQYRTGIGSRLSARIVEWGKNEAGEPLDVGMSVKAGQKLFRVDLTTFSLRVDAGQAALNMAQAALDNLKAPMRSERIDALRAGVAELAARVKDCQSDEARYQRLVEVDETMPIKRLEEARLQLTLAQNQMRAAQARLDEALAGPTKTEIAMSEASVKEAQAMLASAQLDLKDTVVEAPFDGVITQRSKGLGDYVAGAPFIEVLEVTTVDHLEADLRLPEGYLPQVIAGKTRLALRSPLIKGDLDLTVTRVTRDIDVQRGTFGFRVAIPSEKSAGLVPGAFVTCSLILDGDGAGVVVPQRAVVLDAGKSYVFVAGGGKMHRRPIELGDRLTEAVIVKSGLRTGDKVVIGPAELLKDGVPLPDYLLEKPKQP